MLRSNVIGTEENIRYIEISGGHKVWTQKISGGDVKLLLLSGGPSLSSRYLQPFAKYLLGKGITIYFYDQLGTGYSEPELTDTQLWNLQRYVDEVEQVREELGLDKLVLCGHSWGGLLAMEYFYKYPAHVQGLIISNMTASILSYAKSYNLIREQLSFSDQQILKECEERNDFDNPKYQAILERINKEHMCRIELPDYAIESLANMNHSIYETMMGKNEFHPNGNLKDWDRWNDLKNINVPTLLSVGRYDIMSVEDIEKMNQLIPGSSLSICENGSHLSLIDDQETYFNAIIKFINDLKFKNLAAKDSSLFHKSGSKLFANPVVSNIKESVENLSHPGHPSVYKKG